jgi:hypothetical protein
VAEFDDDALVSFISSAIAAHDPLDPWLVNSNYDDHYWDGEAAQVAPSVAQAVSESEVYDLLVAVLRPLVRPPESDDYVRARISASAKAVWGWMQVRR